MSIQLKHEVLVLANWLADGETMPSHDADRSLRDTVARICTQPNLNTVAISLIAVRLAEEIDGYYGSKQ